MSAHSERMPDVSGLVAKSQLPEAGAPSPHFKSFAGKRLAPPSGLQDPDIKAVVRPKSPGVFPALTGVRVLAAYLVFFHHNTLLPCQSGRLLGSILTEGHVGVTIFYVLSGFLIAHRYRDSLGFSRTSLFTYFWNRFARIYPLYCALVVITLLMQHESNPRIWLLHLTLVKGFVEKHKFAGIAQAWSLTVEETFYVLAPLLFLLLRRRGGFLLALLVAYAAGGVYFYFGRMGAHPLVGGFQFVTSYTFFGRAFEFLVGAWLAGNIRGNGTRMPTTWKTYGGLGGMFFAVLMLDYLKSPAYPYGIIHPYGVVINNFVLPLAIVVFFRGLIEEDTYLGRLLSTPIFQLLGKSSYAFYLLHMGVCTQFISIYYSPSRWDQFFLLNVAAILAFKCFEEPVHRWLKGLRRPAPACMASVA